MGQARALYVPLKGVSESIGVLIYRPDRKINKLTVDQKELLLSVATQLGISIERHFLSQRLQEAIRLKDSELLHQTLLNSISHEMRTPLTSILGVASAIEKKAFTDNSLKEISESLNYAGDRLNHVVENLLDMSRLNSGYLGLKLEWHDLMDLIGVVLKKLERTLRGRKVKILIPDNFGLLHIDFRLFEHAISNLILNAIQYAGENCNIEINVTELNNKIYINVIDDGPGIPEAGRSQLFEKFYRVPGTPAGGTGLGLSIVKGIIELHKGKVSYEANNEKGGSKFIIELPQLITPPISTEDSI